MQKEKILDAKWLIVTALGIILIYSGVKFLIKETNFNYYSFLFAHLPKNIITVRFYFSIALRLSLIVIGCGILFRKDFFRKCFIIYGIFTILTIYWKHPLATFERVYLAMAMNGSLPSFLFKNLPQLALISTILNYIFDIFFCGFFVYFLSKANVKKQFA